MALLSVQGLRVSFATRHGTVRAVDGVSFDIARGETLGIVGESGSGKSVTCAALLGLLPRPPARLDGGQAVFDGVDLLRCPERDLRRLRGGRVSMVFQDPMTSLNPYLTVGQQVSEALRAHEPVTRPQARERCAAALAEVGLPDPLRRLGAYPHELSGGMRQRVMIAMALITRPELLIADEPTTALDVTVQAQILELLRRLQSERGMAVLYISHDLGVVAGLCDRILVLYAGRVAESGPTAELFARPAHPYTRALLRSIPALQSRGTPLRAIGGQPPDPARLPSGCAFHPRCEHALASCAASVPSLTTAGPGRLQACLRSQAGDLPDEPHSVPTAHGAA